MAMGCSLRVAALIARQVSFETILRGSSEHCDGPDDADQQRHAENVERKPRLQYARQRDMAGRPGERLGYGARRKHEAPARGHRDGPRRSEEHTSEIQSLMRNSYAVF